MVFRATKYNALGMACKYRILINGASNERF